MGVAISRVVYIPPEIQGFRVIYRQKPPERFILRGVSVVFISRGLIQISIQVIGHMLKVYSWVDMLNLYIQRDGNIDGSIV